MKTLFNPRSDSNTCFVRRLFCLLLLLGSTGVYASVVITASTSALRVDLNDDASLTVTDLASGDVWHQEVKSGFSVASPTPISSRRFQATINGDGGPYAIDVTLDNSPTPKPSFHLTLTPPNQNHVDPHYVYTNLPPYPFLFNGTAIGTGNPWYYVQNNGGEGTLWDLGNGNDMATVRGKGGWAGGQPWWGVTNLNQAMMARLDSFVQIENPGANGDPSAYQIPLEIHYLFYHTGGYVGLAKAYRDYFLSLPNPPAKLTDRALIKPDLSYLKDGTYGYFWDNQGDLAAVSAAMKLNGLDRVIAMFNLHDDPNRLNSAMLNDLANNGSRWLGGLYRTPTPNLFTICPSIDDWVNKVLLGTNGTTEQTILDANNAHNPPVNQWNQLDTDYSEPAWNSGDMGLPYLSVTYGDNLRVVYHDTLPQQLGPSFYDDPNPNNPDYIQSIQDNLTGRQKILDDTRSYTDLAHPSHFVAGSGEGVSAWWTVPHLDYWEGGMEESIYGDINGRHPIDDYQYEFADDCHPLPSPCPSGTPGTWHYQEAQCLDEQHRVPLLALQWHDYVAEAWNWRNSTFVTASLSWKKDLFNILYCGMPMWHVTNDLWNAHSAEYIDSYWKLLPVRKAIGFAEMTKHGWVTSPLLANRAVQYTYWDNNNHVYVNFGDTPYTFTDPNYGPVNIPARGYAMLPDPVSENCEGNGTPTGWTNSGSVNWDYTSVHLEGNQSLYVPGPSFGLGNFTRVDFDNQAEVWVYFKLYLDASPPTSATTIGGLGANGGTVTQLFQIDSSLRPSFGGAQTTDSFALKTAYHVWLHYRKGTGSNGIVEIGFSTDGTKPTSGNKYKKLTTYTGTNDAGRLFLGTTTQTTITKIFDKIRVDNSEIGSNPL